MQTILGPFHPYLENAIVDEISKYKSADPLCPLLVLLPSDALRRRLKILLARERGLSLVNLELLTFSQLSLKLFAEVNGAAVPVLRDDLFFEEVLRQLIRGRQPGAEAFAAIEERAGGCAALWQTLRDLRDAMVDPGVALEALREGQFSRKTNERTADLLVLLQTFLSYCASQSIGSHADLDRLGAAQAPGSSFLRRFAQIFYYGFYDLTQVQIELFHAVAQNYPTTLFFPLLPTRSGHDAWSFAGRFYERHVQGYNTAPAAELVEASDATLPLTLRLFDENIERAYAEPPQSWRCTVANAFGIHDEVAAAAKEILRLADEERFAFNEIGVVARSLETYGPAIKELFYEHQIPITGALEEPLGQFPLIKSVTLLLNLPAKDFLRSQVIDLISSPYFKIGNFTEEKDWARPDLWDLATRELAITKSIHEWRRLRNYTHRDIVISQLSGNDETRVIRVNAAQLRCLAEIVEGLAADLVTLAPSASWSFYAETWKKLLEKYLGIANAGQAPVESTEEPLHEKILAILNQLAGLDAAGHQVSLSDFSHTFQHWLERSSSAVASGNNDGVAVLSATAARGLCYRALFIVGLNEGIFPRTIREDAFLRDREREILERDLGYKINQKLAAFDEEKLLFTLLVGAARERLCCSFQRADEGGRALAPSWYLSDLERTLGRHSTTSLSKITIPRSALEKSAAPPFDRDEFLSPEELIIRLSLAGKDPTPLVEGFALAPALYKQGRTAVAALDQSGERLGGYDGATGSLAEYWGHFSERGLSPTALETYARCPFQFFARHVLGLERLERPEEISGPSAAEFGELGHAILNGVYQILIDQGSFDGKPAPASLDATLAAVAQRVFGEYERNNPIGYALTWDDLKERLMQLLRQVIGRDLEELSASGFKPVSLETETTDRLAMDWPEPSKGMTIRGRMDRIDHDPATNRLRVIDYKFKLGANQATADKNLYRAALRGERLQPPFYCLLGRRWADDHNRKSTDQQIEAKFYYLAPRWSDGPLVASEFGADGLSGDLGAAVKNTIAFLTDGIRHGRFFIQRGEHCQHCEVAEICRKNHPPSLWRAENDPVTRPHRELRGKDPKKL